MKHEENFEPSQPVSSSAQSMTLHNALRAKRFQQFRFHVKMGADPNQQDINGLTPLMKCCYIKTPSTAVRLCSLLLKYTADKSIQDCNKMTSLHHAARGNNSAVLKLLINDSDHYDLNQEDKYKNTVLHYACASGNLESVEIILDQMMRYYLGVSMRNNVGFTPLHIACEFGFLDIARVLVNKGRAPLTVKDGLMFKTPREWLEIHFTIPDDVNPFQLGALIQRKLPSEVATDFASQTKSQYRPHTAPVKADQKREGRKIEREQRILKRPITAPTRVIKNQASELQNILPKDPNSKTAWETLRFLYQTFESQITPSYRKHVEIEWPKPEPPKVEKPEEEVPKSGRSSIRGLLFRMKKGSRGDASGESDSSRTNSPSPDKARMRNRWSAGKLGRKSGSASSADGGSPTRVSTPVEQKAADILARAMKRPKSRPTGGGISSLLLKAAKKQSKEGKMGDGDSKTPRPASGKMAGILVKARQKDEPSAPSVVAVNDDKLQETPLKTETRANSLSKLLLKAAKNEDNLLIKDTHGHTDTPIPPEKQELIEE